MSVIATRMLDIRSQSDIDKNEMRMSQYGAFDRFVQDTNNPNGIISEELIQAAMGANGRDIQIPVIDYDSGVSILNTRNVVIGDSENTSKLYNVTFATYAFEFTVVPTAFDNNDISVQRDFRRKMNKHIKELLATLDTTAIAALDSAKTQVAPDLLGLYTFVADTVVSPLSLYDQVVGDIDPMMESNDFYQNKHLIANVVVNARIKKMGENSVYNAKNKDGQFVGKFLSQSNRITNAANQVGTAYSVEDGSLGLLKRFEREALARTKSRTGHEWDIVNIPELGFEMGSYYYESVGNFSTVYGAATADMTRALKEHYGFAVDLAFVTPYNSDQATIASPILKIAIADS